MGSLPQEAKKRTRLMECEDCGKTTDYFCHFFFEKNYDKEFLLGIQATGFEDRADPKGLGRFLTKKWSPFLHILINIG